MNKFYYVAGPYSSKDQELQIDRGIAHCKYTTELLKAGYICYSPIAETMMLAIHGEIHDTSWETWREKDLKQVSVSDEMIILPLDGWKDSRGTKGEIKFCIQNNIPMSFLDLKTMLLYSVPAQDMLKILDLQDVTQLND